MQEWRSLARIAQKCSSHCQIHHINNTDHLLMDFSISSSPVLLRPLEPEDLELLYTIENDATLWDVCDDTTPYSRYALRQYIANQPQDLHQCRELRLIIVERQTSAPIGIVDLVNYSPKPACGNQHRLAAPQKREGVWRKSHFFVGRICATFLRHQNALCLGLFSK